MPRSSATWTARMASLISTARNSAPSEDAPKERMGRLMPVLPRGRVVMRSPTGDLNHGRVGERGLGVAIYVRSVVHRWIFASQRPIPSCRATNRAGRVYVGNRDGINYNGWSDEISKNIAGWNCRGDRNCLVLRGRRKNAGGRGGFWEGDSADLGGYLFCMSWA